MIEGLIYGSVLGLAALILCYVFIRNREYKKEEKFWNPKSGYCVCSHRWKRHTVKEGHRCMGAECKNDCPCEKYEDRDDL